jgi:transposase
VALELGLSEQTLSNWRKASKAGKPGSNGGKLITPEQIELYRLRAENARLKMEVEIPEKATAYFAKVSR